MSVDETKRAAQIIKAYAEDGEGLTHEECEAAEFDDAQCQELQKVLLQAAPLTNAKKNEMQERQFGKDFIEALGKEIDDKMPQRLRAHWLARYSHTEWFRSDYNLQERMDMLDELSPLATFASPKTVSELLQTLEDPDYPLRKKAAEVLGKMDWPSYESLAIRKNLVKILFQLNDDVGTLALAQAAIFDDDAGIRDLALSGLEKSILSDEATAFMIRAAASAYRIYSERGTMALKSSERLSVARAMIEQCAPQNYYHDDFYSCNQMISTFVEMGAPVIPFLSSNMERYGPEIAVASALVLIQMTHPISKKAIELYLMAQIDQNNLFRKMEKLSPETQMGETLLKVGEEAAPILVEILFDQGHDSFVHAQAARYLGKITPVATATIKALLEASNSLEVSTRLSSISSLGEIGDPIAIPRLQRMAKNDPDLLFREAAQAALNKIMEKFR